MIKLRKAGDRGHADHGWLDSHHTFSFADYHDPSHMRFRALRVINEDRVQPGMGFGTHGHRDMEIISYVLAGALEHKDSLGNGAILRPGELQRITAGTGVRHSEFNPSATEPVHFYQIWLLPRRHGLEPGYEQTAFTDEEKRATLRLVASPDGAEGSLTIQQDASVYLATLHQGEEVHHRLSTDRHVWLQVLRGAVSIDGTRLETGDGAAVSAVPSLAIVGERPAEVMLFDLA